MVEERQTDIPRKPDQDAMDRLRDRTDELELIISSLTIFALFTLPGWLFDKLAGSWTHLSTSLAVAGQLSTALLAGISYGLGACFVIHLMSRAYWVGLIGLRTVFPGGINWSRTPGIGPLTRQHYRDTLPDLDTVIERTDRVASSLFAVISMLTLGFLWFGVILIGVVVVSAAIGSRFGLTNAGIGIGTAVMVALFAGAPLLLYLLDAQLATRFPGVRDSRILAGFVRLLRRISGLAYPQRLVLPVQLTLQSNTRPIVFYIALALSIAFIVVVGNLRAASVQTFTLSGAFDYMEAEQVQGGFRSTYYEDMPSPLDRLRGWPRVDTFEQSDSFVRLFLPYQPLRDNLVLDQLCGSAEEPQDRIACVRKLWTVSIDGRPVSLADFMAAERVDISMRGLIGLVPLIGLEPGIRKIEVVWNPDASDEAAPIDDRYATASITYVISIAYTPGVEMPVN